MLSLIKDWLHQRQGRAQALREIEFISRGYRTAAQLAEEQVPRLIEAGGRTTFAKAYRGRWYDEGISDARAGRLRSQAYNSSDYDIGWLDGINQLRKRGFKHDALLTEYDRIVRQRIARDAWFAYGIVE